ncbi:MAG: Gfo/Idh/MocA family oxidoreductase [Rubrivivax sp.]|nr:Gfo/Idh/MocA family oxidoreductase [Rubrivivax sp.]
MTAADPVRWAIIGPGRIAHKFADALTAVPDARLVAVLGRDADRTAAFAQRWGARPAAALEPLLADGGVDAVYIATPHSAHAQPAAAALRAGKAVLCEKPLVPNAAQARELVALSRQHGVLLMEALWTRFLPGLARVRGWLQAGAIGRVRTLQSSFCFASAYQPDSRLFSPALAGGALLDIGIYNLSLSRWVLAQGGEPTVVAFHVRGDLAPTGVDQRVHGQLIFEGGEVAQWVCALDGQATNDLHILGTQGSITVHAPFWHVPRVSLHRAGQAAETHETPCRHNGFEPQIEEAQRCLRAGLIESPGIPHAETLAVLELIDAMRLRLGVRYPFE